MSVPKELVEGVVFADRNDGNVGPVIGTTLLSGFAVMTVGPLEFFLRLVGAFHPIDDRLATLGLAHPLLSVLSHGLLLSGVSSVFLADVVRDVNHDALVGVLADFFFAIPTGNDIVFQTPQEGKTGLAVEDISFHVPSVSLFVQTGQILHSSSLGREQ